MSLQVGLKYGFKNGLKVGLNNLFGDRYPSNAAEWLSYFPGITTPSSIWTLQEASGTLADAIGGITLTSVSSVSYRQTGDPSGRYSVSFDNVSARFSAASNATYDLNASTSLTALFRAYIPATAAAGGFIGKRQASVNLEGYAVNMIATSSYLTAFCDPGAAAQATATVSVAADTATYIDVMIVIDRGSNTVKQYSPFGTASASIAAIGTLTNTGVFSLGAMSGAASAIVGTKMSYAAVWYGTALTQANYNTIVAG
jgi:hypothetical protein